MYAKITETIRIEGPLGQSHALVELWRVWGQRVAHLGDFATVCAARRLAERVGPGSYHFTSAAGREYLRLEIAG